jgi:DNA primase
VESVLPRMKDGRQAFFLFLPDGEDPDTLVRKEGAAGFDARLREATPLSQFFFDELGQGRQPGDARRQGAPGRTRETAAGADSRWRLRRPDAQRLTELTGVARGATRRRTNAVRTSRAARTTQKRSLVRSAIAHAAAAAVAGAGSLEPPYRSPRCASPASSCCWNWCCWCTQRPDISTGALLEHFAEPRGTGRGPAETRLAGPARRTGRTCATNSLDAITQLESADAASNARTSCSSAARLSELGTEEKRELLALQRELRARQADP